ncbi:MAG: DegV family protein [Oscillospiraceae bacterium]
MNIRISADSTCDLSPELIEKYDIRITPLYIVRDGQSLVDGKDITPDEIYAHVNSGGGMCSTAAVSVYDYTQFFRRQLEECDAVVHFHISGDMSACYQNACIAAQEVGNVYPGLAASPPAVSWCWRRLVRESKLTAERSPTMEPSRRWASAFWWSGWTSCTRAAAARALPCWGPIC